MVLEAAKPDEPDRGRAARSPWAIPGRGWKDIVWRTWRASGRNRLGTVAGGVTFYLLLAAFPALGAFVSVYGLFLDLGAVERQMHEMAAVFPHAVVDLVGQEMVRLATQRHEALGAGVVGGVLVSAWSANAGMKALFDGLNVAYGEIEKRPYLLRSLVTYGATLGTLVLLVGVTALTVAAPMLLGAVGLRETGGALAPLRWLVVYLLAAGGFTLVYRLGPSRTPPKWRWAAGGAVAAALAWMVGSMGLSSYLHNFAHFGATYGALGAAIGMMLWVWFSVMVVLWGAELNAEIEHQTGVDTTAGPEAPMGQRGAAMADTVGEAFTVSPGEAVAYLSRQPGYALAWLRGVLRRR
jgi:membrane protein